jgi:hypothetical protein
MFAAVHESGYDPERRFAAMPNNVRSWRQSGLASDRLQTLKMTRSSQ